MYQALSLLTQALAQAVAGERANQLDKCFAIKSKMITMGFREGLSAQFFIFDFWNDYVCFFVWKYAIKQSKLQVKRYFALLSKQWMLLICLLQGAAIFIEQALLSFKNIMFTLTTARSSTRVVDQTSGSRLWELWDHHLQNFVLFEILITNF